MKQLILITAMLLALTAKLIAQNNGVAVINPTQNDRQSSHASKEQSKNEVVNQKN